MSRIKVLCLGFLSVIMLVAVTSCGVDAPTTPLATVVPADGSTIKSSDSIVITFTASMTPGALTLSGDMARESDLGVWSRTSQTNDTLTISPAFASGVWTAGEHTLVVDVVGTNGVPVSTLRLHYTVEAVAPTASAVPADGSTIIGSEFIVILFSEAMKPSTLTLSGDMAAESNGGIWSTTNNTNDTLAIRPLTVWSDSATTLIINVDSVTGISFPSLTLNYSVDVSVPVPVVSPGNPLVVTAINSSVPIVITFTISMEPATLVLAGTLAIESNGGIWSSLGNTNNTLTISPLGAWPGDAQTLSVDVVASNGVSMDPPILELDYFVDIALPTFSVTPVTDSSISSGQDIEIVFDKSMDVATLTPSGTVWDNASIDPVDLWSETNIPNDTLTILPATTWPVETIDLTIDIVDLVGNSLTIPTHNYIVDVTAPVITLLGDTPSIQVAGTSYNELGATASDYINIDSPNEDISASIVIDATAVDMTTADSYNVTYNVSDAAGNPALPVTRTVDVVPGAASVATGGRAAPGLYVYRVTARGGGRSEAVVGKVALVR